MSQLARLIPSSGPGSGTVTSISAGTGITLTPNPITTTGTVALTVPVVIANGGTNATSFTTTDGTVYFDGTRLVTTTTGTSGQILTSNGAGVAPTYQSPAASSITITGDSGGGLTGNSFTFTGGVTGLTFSGSGSTETLTGTLAIAHGGTNATSMTNTDGVVYYDGTRLVTTTVGTATNVLTSNGAGMAPTFQALPSSGITTIDGDTGSITGATVNIKSGGTAGAGSTVSFSGSGTTLTFNVTGSVRNTMIGAGAGNASAGAANTALGAGSGGVGPLASINGGVGNSAVGDSCLQQLTSGNLNTALGQSAGCSYFSTGITTGSDNVFIGARAGQNYTGSESYNIIIGTNNVRSPGESNVLSIGLSTGSGTDQINKTFIAGIQGITVTGTAILVSASDQLGIAVSSERYKENIENLYDDRVLQLQPVSFNYKVGDDRSRQTGLIAEEVYKIMPELVVLDKEGLPQTVKYHELPVLLLNEIQKLKGELEELKEKLEWLGE